MNIQSIAFDADDTLWVNEPLFRDAEARFCELLAPYVETAACNKKLFDFEMQNLPLYGYGIKPFVLSLIEAAIKLSDGNVSNTIILQLIDLGKDLLQAPVEVLDGVEDTLQQLKAKEYQLVVATKGDLLDQERKLIKSGLADYFHHIEIVPDKKPKHYQKLVNHLDIVPEQFLMIGNSIKSDILPVLDIGAWGFHIPFHTTWEHELVYEEIEHPKFREFSTVSDIIELL